MKFSERPGDIYILKTLNRTLSDTFLEDFEDEICEGDIDPTEIPIFIGSLTMACYILLTEGSIENTIHKFASWVVGRTTNENFTKDNPSATTKEINKYFNELSIKFEERQNEFIDLITEELLKPATERTFEKVTKVMTGHLFGKSYFNIILEGIIREQMRSVFLTLQTDRGIN